MGALGLIPAGPTGWSEAAVWQEVEFGSYAADLQLWRELAAEARGKVVELGAGSGRVGRALAAEGHDVVAIERDPEMAADLSERAGDLPLTAVEGDAARLAEIPEAADARLVIGPLQVAQLLGAEDRAEMLAGAARCLRPGGVCAMALVDESTLVSRETMETQPPPDMRDVEGWVYSSEPLWVQMSDDTLRIRRMRERVSPEGDHVRRVHDELLARLSPEELEREGEAEGLRVAGRRSVAANEHEAGSVVVILEAP